MVILARASGSLPIASNLTGLRPSTANTDQITLTVANVYFASTSL